MATDGALLMTLTGPPERFASLLDGAFPYMLAFGAAGPVRAGPGPFERGGWWVGGYAAASAAYRPSRASSASWSPDSTTRPWSSTAI